ncbi:hypothetical protein K435DRAFT_857698 [Dendrothele bispora CBS 962.96]|uniref:Uncharacterized protein n=1 Tax=Dendrothele bispora (strain CBS 962.96) TaxID=1314807 RepID=A0A4S8M587_DENBC|nr:hypothetical protein K435DRAFT_857698 [Dendrothele bispora CBS 962.96]
MPVRMTASPAAPVEVPANAVMTTELKKTELKKTGSVNIPCHLWTLMKQGNVASASKNEDPFSDPVGPIQISAQPLSEPDQGQGEIRCPTYLVSVQTSTNLTTKPTSAPCAYTQGYEVPGSHSSSDITAHVNDADANAVAFPKLKSPLPSSYWGLFSFTLLCHFRSSSSRLAILQPSKPREYGLLRPSRNENND